MFGAKLSPDLPLHKKAGRMGQVTWTQLLIMIYCQYLAYHKETTTYSYSGMMGNGLSEMCEGRTCSMDLIPRQFCTYAGHKRSLSIKACVMQQWIHECFSYPHTKQRPISHTVRLPHRLSRNSQAPPTNMLFTGICTREDRVSLSFCSFRVVEG